MANMYSQLRDLGQMKKAPMQLQAIASTSTLIEPFNVL
jgi:hypothetical protein